MTSDSSSDEENLDQLREAQDTTFINDSLFSDSPEKRTPDNRIKKAVPSLRSTRNDEDQFNFLKVTPEFRQYVGKQLSRFLDRKLEEKFAHFEGLEAPLKKRKKGGVRLLSESERFLRVSDRNIVENTASAAHNAKAKRAKKTESEVTEDLLKEVAVSAEDVLTKKDVKHWSQRSKAPVFRYKKSANGQLTLVEPEFK